MRDRAKVFINQKFKLNVLEMEIIMNALVTSNLIDLNEPPRANEMAEKFNGYAKKDR